MSPPNAHQPYRREVFAAGVASLAMSGLTLSDPAMAAPVVALPVMLPVTLQVNGQRHALTLDTRTTLLDALREHLQLTGSKKGCDHGQCGACTVMLDGQRANACLTLAVMAQAVRITTIEGLGQPGNLHPMQAAFVKHDGYPMRLLHAGSDLLGAVADAGRDQSRCAVSHVTGRPECADAGDRARRSASA